MKAAFVKSPLGFRVDDMPIRDIKENEVLVKVMACCLCGHDIIVAKEAGRDWQPFGHEIAGVVERKGRNVRNVAAGDRVVLESGTFDRYSDTSRNGRVDLDNSGPNFWLKEGDAMGFAEYIIVPEEVCVRFDGLSFEEASVVEPLSVALDLVKTAGISLGDDVMVIGLGPIGLMAARLARASGARKIYGSELSHSSARIDVARRWGIDDIICPDRSNLTDYAFPKGGVDRVLVTAPPRTIATAIDIALPGGTIAFLGIDYGPGKNVTFDANSFHVKTLQLKASFASPSLYFPQCIDLIKSGTVKTKDLITHTFALENIGEAVTEFIRDSAGGIKACMISCGAGG